MNHRISRPATSSLLLVSLLVTEIGWQALAQKVETQPKQEPLPSGSVSQLQFPGGSVEATPPNVPTIESNASSQDFPKLNLPAQSPDAARSDPLFQQIERMILNGQSSNPNTKPSHGPRPDAESIPATRWHAIECLLVAARKLDQESAALMQNENREKARQLKAISQTIRTQVLELCAIP